MKIALFHYHLRPGEVTNVIALSVRNLLRHCSSLSEIRLVTGAHDGTDQILEEIRSGFDRQTADKVRLDVLDEMSYVEGSGVREIDLLAAKLEARYDEETYWWVHNYHTGENPVFTAALMKIADTGKRRMLLHIHQFPECGMYENLRRMNTLLPVPPYPSGPGIRYLVVNERDREILTDAGLGESTHLLINPLPMDPVDMIDTEPVFKALEKHGRRYGYIPGAPILLYPARAERRKNILEAALVSLLLDDPVNLVVTHAGVSIRDREYSEKIESAFTGGLISGFWCPEATGDPNLVHAALIASSSAVISTSVQEGFGLPYLNALHWQKPLMARYLDILDGVLDSFGDYPRRFWADLRIPSKPDISQRTKNAYENKIRGVAALLPGKSVKSMLSAVSKISSGGGIDVSYLSVDDQIESLKNARSDALWLEETRTLNRDLVDSLNRTLRAKAPEMDQALELSFGEGVYVRNFIGIIEDFGSKRTSTNPVKIRDSVLKSFGRIDYMRLLLGD